MGQGTVLSPSATQCNWLGWEIWNLNSLLRVNKYGKIGALVSQISENHCMSKPEFTISDAPSSEMQMEQINLDSFCSAWRKKYISGANCAKHPLPATGAVTLSHFSCGVLNWFCFLQIYAEEGNILEVRNAYMWYIYDIQGFCLMKGLKLIAFVSPGREGALPQHCDSLFGDLLRER